jgi:hypothetical protein
MVSDFFRFRLKQVVLNILISFHQTTRRNDNGDVHDDEYYLSSKSHRFAIKKDISSSSALICLAFIKVEGFVMPEA